MSVELNETRVAQWLDENQDFLERYLMDKQSKKEANTQQKSPTRKEFKDFNYHDKMYSLVKNLNESLDLEITCKKILKTVSLLLDADRCSLFLVSKNQENQNYLVSVVFDAQNNCSEEKDTNLKFNNGQQIQMEFGVGIAGNVALTGKPLNIQNAYSDSRFNSDVDKQTGYLTKSILCLPIINELGECIAVAEAINKLGEHNEICDFTRHDEELFCKFMPFIVIAIRNSNLYYKSCKEAYLNKLLLELASIVFNKNTTVDDLIEKIIKNSLKLLNCVSCQVILLSQNDGKLNKNKLIDKIYGSESIDIDFITKIINSNEIYHDKVKYSLYIPVKNSSNQVVALIKVKKTNLFSQDDLQSAQTFALFCGIGIQNIILYERVVRAMNMQRVALDVLSYHASSSEKEALTLSHESIPEPYEYKINTFSFDEQTLNDLETLKACISIFANLDLIEKFNIPYKTLSHFFLTVKKNYRPVAYHNWRHGFNVMCSMYTMLTTGNFQRIFSDLEILSLLIACICHDVDHRGTTNTFQIKIQSPLAKLYSTSTMEQHHFNQTVMILHNNTNNILLNLTSNQYTIVMDLIEKAILATDLSLHFNKIDKFLYKVDKRDIRFDSNESKELLLSMLMSASDLSGSAKPWPCHYRLSKLVSNEFFQQGDLEKEILNEEKIVDMMNRAKEHQLPQMQIQFIQSICLPLYTGIAKCNRECDELVQNCETNIKEWTKLIKN